MSKRKAAIIAFSVLCLTQPYFSVFTTTPNNWREGLMGQVLTLGTPFKRKKTIIKRGVEGDRRGGAETPHHT